MKKSTVFHSKGRKYKVYDGKHRDDCFIARSLITPFDYDKIAELFDRYGNMSGMRSTYKPIEYTCSVGVTPPVRGRRLRSFGLVAGMALAIAFRI